MGYTVPVSRKFFIPSTNILITDTNEYYTNSDTYVEKVRFKLMNIISESSTFTIKAEIKTTNETYPSYLKIQRNGVTIDEFNTTSTAYVTFSATIPAGNSIGSYYTFLIKQPSSYTGVFTYIINCSITGEEALFKQEDL